MTKPSDIFKCSEFNDRNTPYCWDDKCQSEQDVTNKNCGSSFSCTAVGTFPGNFQFVFMGYFRIRLNLKLACVAHARQIFYFENH